MTCSQSFKYRFPCSGVRYGFPYMVIRKSRIQSSNWCIYSDAKSCGIFINIHHLEKTVDLVCITKSTVFSVFSMYTWLASNPLSLSDNEHLRSKGQAVYQEEMLVLVSVKICTDKCENFSFSYTLKCEIMLLVVWTQFKKKKKTEGGRRCRQSAEWCLRKSN